MHYVKPHPPAFDQPTSLTLVRPGNAGSLVLALANDSCESGTLAVAVDVALAPRTMAWLFTDMGQIVSAMNPWLALTPQSGNPPTLAVRPRGPGFPPMQSWTLTGEGLIYNMDSFQVLTVSIGDSDITVGMLSVVEGGDLIGIHQCWEAAPHAAH